MAISHLPRDCFAALAMTGKEVDLSRQQFLQLSGKGRHNILKFAHHPKVSLLEYVRLRVLVNGNDGLRATATRHMLAGS